MSNSEELERALARYVGAEIGPPAVGPDLVNAPMVRHWCEILGDANPVYTDPDVAARSVHGGLVAPPTMLQVWTMAGVALAGGGGPAADLQQELHALLSEHGYTSVVATNCEQVYDRYLRPDDRVTATTVIEAISPEKTTGLGTGRFIDTRTTYRDAKGERVAWMTFRVLKFKPAQPAQAASPAAAPAKPRRLRPLRSHDNDWWWQGVARGDLLIQRCAECGTLRHPPRPMCGACQSLRWDSVAASGRGVVYSHVVMHHPPIPGYGFPLAVALVELEEGTRIVSNVVGCAPDAVRIGMPVQLEMQDVDEELRLPLFRPVSGAAEEAR
ncbi:MAG: OB-fold domain-containing protein [Deltaproteobacteria bacterium]|nr:OB-fold domain-containing protein [Deltaproteobacteria bacterium]